MVWKCAKMVYTHITLNTQEPMMTMIVGTTLLPSPLEAAMVQSIKALMAYDQPIIVSLSIPASATADSLVNSDKNSLPNKSSAPPKIPPAAKE